MRQKPDRGRERPSLLLRRLENVLHSYGNGASAKKLELLKKLERRRMTRADGILRLHESLTVLRTYPDDRRILSQAERMLSRFSERPDLKQFRDELVDTGIAGTTIYFPFYWLTAVWLVERWPESIKIDWASFENKERIVDFFPNMLLLAETPAYDEVDFEIHEWLDMLKGPGETDAAFLIRRFEKLHCDPYIRELLYDWLNVTLVIRPGRGTPSRTLPRYERSPVVFQKTPLSRERPDLRTAVLTPPQAMRPVSSQEGAKLIDLARESMVTRSRDLDSFIYADPKTVRMVDCGDGLQFATFTYVPERRLLMESLHSFLTIKNGVPLGYVLCSSLFGSVEIAYNVFDTYRGLEAARVYGRILGMLRALFGCDVFSVDPFQLGKENKEGLESGAWWFYYKLGFRPVDPGVKRVLRAELNKMKKNPEHRSSIDTLKKLTQESVFYFLNKPREDVIGLVSHGDMGLRIIEYIAQNYGSDREAAEEVSSREAAKLVGLPSLRGFSADEKIAWRRWGPLIMTLRGVSRWSPSDKRALIGVVRAKAGRYESDFVRKFDAHRRLRKAVLALAK